MYVYLYVHFLLDIDIYNVGILSGMYSCAMYDVHCTYVHVSIVQYLICVLDARVVVTYYITH